MSFLSSLFGSKRKRSAELTDEQKDRIINDFGALLEDNAERDVLAGKLSDLPHPKEVIRQVLLEAILLKATLEPGGQVQGQLEAGCILLENFIEDEEAEPLQRVSAELIALRAVFSGTEPPNTQALEQLRRDAASMLAQPQTFARLQAAREEALKQIHAIRALARQIRNRDR